MKILLFETNLFWSSRLRQTLTGLGHEVDVLNKLPTESSSAKAAIVNLAESDLRILVPRLKSLGLYVIGHAGHKEKELHALGVDAGCDRLATNGEITFKLGSILKNIEQLREKA